MRVGGGAKSAPPPEGNAAGWGGGGRRMQDEPHDRARRGHAPCKPRRGDHRGSKRRVERATTGAARHAPPPPAEGRMPRLVPATREQRRENDKAPPPPHTPPPPQGWGMQEGRGGQRPPLPRTKWQDGEAAGRGCGTDYTTVPKGSKRRAGPSGEGTGGANAEWEGR